MEEGGVVAEVKPKPQRGLRSKAMDWLEGQIVKLMYNTTTNHHHYLSGNYAPVPYETPPSNHLPVIGHLPVSTSNLISFFLIYFLSCQLFSLFLFNFIKF